MKNLLFGLLFLSISSITNAQWKTLNGVAYLDSTRVVIGEYLDTDTGTLFHVRNTRKVQFDAGNCGDGTLVLLLQARNNKQSKIQFADGVSSDFITFDDGKFYIAENNSLVGIGNTDPQAQLDVSGDIMISKENSGLILKSPNGSEWKVTIDNDGRLVSSEIATKRKFEVNIEELEAGTYFIYIRNENGEVIKKERFIKQ